jgi:YD repeat-containing protein
LAPAVTLQFNSRSRAEDPGYSSVAGNGWQLSVDSYGAWTPWLTGTPDPVWRINGVAYNQGSGTLQQAPDWRVQYSGRYVYIYSPSGITYQFAEALHDFYCVGSELHWRTVGWVLQKETDAVGNEIDYTYDSALPVDPASIAGANNDLMRPLQIHTCSGDTSYLNQINLKSIAYNAGRTVVEFGYAMTPNNVIGWAPQANAGYSYRKDGPYGKADADTCVGPYCDNYKYWAFFTTRLLRGIRVRQDGQYVAGYEIGYDEHVIYDQAGHWYPNQSSYWIKGLQQMKIDPSSGVFLTLDGDAWRAGLPIMQFHNGDHLDWLENMYGGVVNFSYAGGKENGTVTARTVTDQVTGQTNTWSYAYGPAISHKVKVDGVSSLVGYAYATETLPASLSSPGTTSKVYHEFLNDDESSAASIGLTVGTLGKERLARYVVNNVTQREVERWWTNDTADVYNGAGITYLTKEEERTYDAGGLNPQPRDTRSSYQTGHQATNTRAAAQFGLPTLIQEYNGTEAPANLVRTTERWYFGREEIGDNPATNHYLVNKLAEEKLWDNRNQGSVCQRQTRYIYDTARDAGSQTQYNQRPTRGLLQEVWQAGDQGTGCDAGWLKTVAYDHDAWGNVIWQKTPNGTQTTTAYDRDFSAAYAVALYPFTLTVTPQSAGEQELTTSYRYYGLYGAEAAGSGRVGQLQATIDANNAYTRYTYDDFGRMIALRQPGAAFSAPASESLSYSDVPYASFGVKDPNLYPLRIRHQVRNDTAGDGNGGATYQDEWTYYNGLGQTIQTQKPGMNAGQTAVVDLNYNPLGQAAVQTMPYFRNVAAGGA